MIEGIGIDAVDIARVNYRRLGNKVYTEDELAYIEKKGAGAKETAAGIFAAKEATLKAFGTGIGTLSLRDIEVDHKTGGRPFIKLSPKAQKFSGRSLLHLSITHTNFTAFAEVIWEEL